MLVTDERHYVSPLPTTSGLAEKLKTALDVQIGGDHYKKYAIQPIEYSMANGLNPCQANVVKYITRYKDKGGVEDLKKVIHYVQLLIEIEENEGWLRKG